MEIKMNVYKITNSTNGKIYIGQSIYMNDDYYGSGVLIRRALEKYGKESFIKEIIDEASTQIELSEKEKYWIKFYNSVNKIIGYNISPGGEYGDTLTYHPNRDEICKKMSVAAKRRAQGKGNSFYGKRHTNEIKLLIGCKNSEHAKRRAVEYSDEQKKEKYSRSWMIGKHLSDETKRKISETKKERALLKPKKLKTVIDKVTEEQIALVKQLYVIEQLGIVKVGELTELGYGSIKILLKELNITERDYKKTNKNPMQGRHHSDDAKRKISESRRKKDDR